MIALIFDVETTGFTLPNVASLEAQPSIIEFFGSTVDLKTGKIINEYHSKIKPPNPLPDKPAPGSTKTITEITGITNDSLADAPLFKTVSKKILTMIQDAPMVIAHNANFDKMMIDLEFERLNTKVKWPRIICTIEQSMHIKGYRLNLSALHKELFGQSPAGSMHRAGKDVEVLTRCAVEMFKRGWL